MYKPCRIGRSEGREALHQKIEPLFFCNRIHIITGHATKGIERRTENEYSYRKNLKNHIKGSEAWHESGPLPHRSTCKALGACGLSNVTYIVCTGTTAKLLSHSPFGVTVFGTH